MTGDLKPYPEYKDSGVPWLGKVPKHWGLLRLKYLFEVISGATPTGDATKWDGDIVWITPDDLGKLRTKDVYTSRRRITDLGYRSCGTTLAPAGSIAISTRAPIGHLAIVRVAACVNQGCRMLVPRSCQNVEYHYYQLVAARPELESLGQGSTFTELRRSGLAAVLLATPPPQEQAHIAGYLRAVDEKINRFIRNRRRLIEVLNEYKQAIINRYVTGQIDPRTGRPYPRYKPSGIDWLGDIPEHWTIVPLKYICKRIQNGTTPSTSVERYYQEGIVPWYGPSSVGEDREVGNPVRMLSRVAFEEGGARLIAGPAILIVVIGATAGRMALLAERGATNQQITAYVLRDNVVIPAYVLDQLRFAEKYLKATASTATIPILDSGIVSRLPIALPPTGEQQEIIDAIEDRTAPLRAVVEKTKREIDLIREYRTRLIADVVTGNLDVRGLAPAAGEEIAETDDWAEDSDEEAVLQDDQADLVEEAADGDT